MGERFGSYEILYELKSGGMGSVLLGRRRGPGAFEQLVAIKTIRKEYAAAPAVRAMFLDEAAILARLNHPGIATVHDFGEEAGNLYMVMEYVAGIPFRELADLTPPPIVATRAIAEACRGLHAAHEVRDIGGALMGLVHRDISPDNLMLGFDGHVKVIDFGIALVKNRQAPVTEFGTVKGKPPYMSPEQVKNEAMDRRSDVFSLAVVLWELLVGKALFEGDSIFAIAYAVDNQVIEPPSKALGVALPLGLDAAVMNALDRDLTRRTPTAAAFAEELEQVLQAAAGETLEAWAERELAQPRVAHRTWLAGIATGVNQLGRALGRASGEVTELGAAHGNAPTPLPAASPLVETEPGGPGTSIGGIGVDEFSPRRRLAPLVIGLLLLLAAGTVAYLALHRHGTEPPRDAAPIVADARVIVVVPADATPVDAGEPDAMLVDAGRLDAGHHHADARHVPAHDATPMIVAPDAAAPVGSGFVTIKYKPGPYANISIDGSGGMPGPIFRRKIAAGRHVIRFLDPQTGDTLDTQTVTVDDGQLAEVTQQ